MKSKPSFKKYQYFISEVFNNVLCDSLIIVGKTTFAAIMKPMPNNTLNIKQMLRPTTKMEAMSKISTDTLFKISFQKD